MPASTAATITLASSPEAKPLISTGMVSGSRGRALAGGARLTSSLWAPASMAKADCPARHAIGRLVERTMGQHHGICASAPFTRDWNRLGRVALFEIERRQSVQTLADNRDHRGAGIPRGDAYPHLLARFIIRLVETDIEKIRCLCACLARPAALEGNTRWLSAAILPCKIEPVFAKSDDGGNFCRRVSGKI